MSTKHVDSLPAPRQNAEPSGPSKGTVNERVDQVLEHGQGRIEVIVRQGRIATVHTTLTDVSE